MQTLKGLIVPLPAPFLDKSLDLMMLERVVKYCTDAGVNQFIFGGTTTEGMHLQPTELVIACRTICGIVPKSVLLMGLLEKSEEQIVETIKELRKAEESFPEVCDGFLLAPSFDWTNDIYGKCLDILAEIPSPVFLYSLPPNFYPDKETCPLYYDQIDFYAETYPLVEAVKHASTDTLRDLFMEDVPINLFCGSDFAVGEALDFCDGCVSAGALLMPREFVQVSVGFGNVSYDDKKRAKKLFDADVLPKLRICFSGLKPPEVVFLVKLFLREKGLIFNAYSRYYSAYHQISGNLKNEPELRKRLIEAGLI